MPKRLPNEELFEDGDKTLRFVANNGFGKAVNTFGKDISVIFSDLGEGYLPVEDIENVLVCGMVDIDDEPIKESDRQSIAEDLVNRYGLIECQQIVWVLLTHIMIGEKKSSEISVNQRREILFQSIDAGLSTNSKRVLFSWVAVTLTSIIVTCTSFSVYAKFIA